MNNRDDVCCGDATDDTRRTLLKATLGAAAAVAVSGVSWFVPGVAQAAAMTQAQRDAMTPDQILAMLKNGNLRFRTGKMEEHDYRAQKRASAAGQYPAAVILSCIDSRTPAEIIFDSAIGDTFNARIAGNIANDDLLGSLEFACAVSGAKVILVMGHTACGAIKGAIDGAKLGHLTGLLDRIKPAVEATKFDGEHSSKNDAYVDAVAATNVRHTMDMIRQQSDVLAGLEKEGKIKIAGSMYHFSGGIVEFYS